MRGFLHSIFFLAIFLVPLAHFRGIHDQTELPKRALSAMFVWILVSIWTFCRSRGLGKEHFATSLPAVFLWGMGFLLWQLAIWPFSLEASQGIDAILITLESLAWLWLAFHLLDSRNSRRIALLVIVASGFMASLFGLAQFEQKFPSAFPHGIAGSWAWLRSMGEQCPWGNPFGPLEQTDAPGSYFGHTNFAAEFVVLGFVVAFTLALGTFWRSLRRRNWPEFLVSCFGFAVAGVLALFLIRSSSRSVALAAAIGVGAAWFHIFVYDLLHRPLGGKKLVHVLCHACLAVGLGVVLFLGSGLSTSPRSGQEQVSISERLASSLDFENTTIRERFDLWDNTLAMSQANAVFGVGPGNFKVAYPAFAFAHRKHETGRLTLARQPRQPHNEYLNILAENGVVGFLLMLIAFLAFLLPFIRRRNAFLKAVDDEDNVALAMICSVVAFLVTAAFAFPSQQTGTRLVFLTLVALGLRLNKGGSEKTIGPGPRFAPSGHAWAIGFLFALVLSAAHYRAAFKSSESIAQLVSGSVSSSSIGPAIVALRVADQAVRRNPARADYQLMRAQVYRSVGLLNEAEAGYFATLKRAPNMPNAWLGIAKVRLEAQRPGAAKIAAKRALELQPEEPQILVAVGEIYEMIGDRNGALAAIEKALRLSPLGPDRLQALLSLTRIHSALGNHTTAGSFLAQAENLAPGHQSVLETKAYFLERHQPKSRSSFEAWAKFSAVNPNHSEAHLRLCENWLKRSEFQRALKESENAFVGDNNLIIALYRRAQAQVGLNRLQEARDTLYECIQRISRSMERDESLFSRSMKLITQIESRLRSANPQVGPEEVK